MIIVDDADDKEKEEEEEEEEEETSAFSDNVQKEKVEYKERSASVTSTSCSSITMRKEEKNVRRPTSPINHLPLVEEKESTTNDDLMLKKEEKEMKEEDTMHTVPPLINSTSDLDVDTEEEEEEEEINYEDLLMKKKLIQKQLRKLEADREIRRREKMGKRDPIPNDYLKKRCNQKRKRRERNVDPPTHPYLLTR